MASPAKQQHSRVPKGILNNEVITYTMTSSRTNEQATQILDKDRCIKEQINFEILCISFS